jgi:hypothetical protein
VLGAGQAWSDYGFRRLPYHWQLEARALLALESLKPGLELGTDYRFENSLRSIETQIRWLTFDAFRWFGLGNDSKTEDRELSLVRLHRLTVEPVFVGRFGQWRKERPDSADTTRSSRSSRLPFRGSIAFGPLVRYSGTEAREDTPFSRDRPLGFDPLWQVGVGARLELRRTDRPAAPRRGFKLTASLTGYPGILDLPAAYGTAAAEATGYVPLIGDGPHLALRAGAERAFGRYPAFDAATVGGRSSVRGYTSGRFAGDAATYGGAELRVPVGIVRLLVQGELGAFALVDAGRVWVNGESPGGWHSGYGGGLWFDAFERAISVAYATGERGRFYVWLGLPF